ncbi:MAG: RNA methyltransferase [Lachnospiraceae bacterium]|nr:RNA methyltransferase [Lachnospiraceae bacterium]
MNTTAITDLKDPALKIFSGMSETELFHYYEPDPGVFVAESANVMIRALEAGYEPLSLLIERERFDTEGAQVFSAVREILGEEKLDSLPVYIGEREVVTALTGYKLVRGLWGVFRRKQLLPLRDFLKDKDRIAVLYDIVNPTNTGAIIRSAAALGMDGVVLTFPSVDPLTRRSARVSMGTAFQIPWTKLRKNDLKGPAFIGELKSLGFKTVAMALREDSAGVDDERIVGASRLAVVLGTEGEGLPDEIISVCDLKAMIPMHHGVDSLNVAAASAVIFWEIMKGKQRL